MQSYNTLRIIAGKLKERKLFSPPGLDLRPTSDKVRESLFNILSDRIVGATFLDLYAGTGAIGIEALSRGAEAITFVENNPAHLPYLKKNIKLCTLDKSAALFETTVIHYLEKMTQPFDLVFLDPPYNTQAFENLLPRLKQGDIIRSNGRLIFEHDRKRSIPQDIGKIFFIKNYRYGETVLSFYGKS